eukprot:5744960-Pyramimonas_sp.AAC.1
MEMTPRAPGGAQDDLQDGSRYPKMSHNGSHDAPICPKTAPRRLPVDKELPQEAPKRPTPWENLCAW